MEKAKKNKFYLILTWIGLILFSYCFWEVYSYIYSQQMQVESQKLEQYPGYCDGVITDKSNYKGGTIDVEYSVNNIKYEKRLSVFQRTLPSLSISQKVKLKYCTQEPEIVRLLEIE